MDTSRAPLGAPLEGCVAPCMFTLLQEGILRAPPSHGHRQQIRKLDDHYSSSVGVPSCLEPRQEPHCLTWAVVWRASRWLPLQDRWQPIPASSTARRQQEPDQHLDGWTMAGGTSHRPISPSLPSFPPSQRSFVLVPPLSESFCHATSVLGETYVTTCFG